MKLQFASMLLLALGSTPAMSTVIVETRQVTVDPASSHATRSSAQFVLNQSGLLELVETNTSTRLAGNFDLIRTSYIWDDPLFAVPPNDPPGETWINFANVQLQTLDVPVGIDLSIGARLLDGGSFIGDNGPCSSPQPPNTFCTGFSTGPLSTQPATARFLPWCLALYSALSPAKCPMMPIDVLQIPCRRNCPHSSFPPL